MNVWYVKFPTHLYKEDVKALALKNNLKIIDDRFQDGAEQCVNAPKLTLKTAKAKELKKQTVEKTLIED